MSTKAQTTARDVLCSTCGRVVEPSHGGHPRTQHFECGKVSSMINQLENKIELLHFARNEHGARARRFIRSRLIVMGNQWLQSFNAKRDDTTREFLRRPTKK